MEFDQLESAPYKLHKAGTNSQQVNQDFSFQSSVEAPNRHETVINASNLFKM